MLGWTWAVGTPRTFAGCDVAAILEGHRGTVATNSACARLRTRQFYLYVSSPETSSGTHTSVLWGVHMMRERGRQPGCHLSEGASRGNTGQVYTVGGWAGVHCRGLDRKQKLQTLYAQRNTMRLENETQGAVSFAQIKYTCWFSRTPTYRRSYVIVIRKNLCILLQATH